MTGGRWVEVDGLWAYRPESHTGECQDGCPGRRYMGVVAVDTEAWSTCFCSCHEENR